MEPNSKISESIQRKFVESYDVSDFEVLTHDGYVDVIASNKTVEYTVYKVLLEDGQYLDCADDHILIDKNHNEVFAKDSEGRTILTRFGPKVVIDVIPLNIKENMYDLTVDGDHTYYTNDILSHNTVVSGIKFLWSINFYNNVPIAIAANIEKGSIEVLTKIKQMFNSLPIWMQQGVEVWNVKSINLENGSKVLTSATNGDAFRGFSIAGGEAGHSTLYIDECAFIPSKKFFEFSDSVMPTVSSDPNSNIIKTSTVNGFNHYYHDWDKAIHNKNGYTPVRSYWWEHPDRDEAWKERTIAEIGFLTFQQNYGCEFLGSSRTLLSAEGLEYITSTTKEPIEYTDNLSVYEKPRKDGTYLVLVDLAAGDGHGDYTAIQVIKINKNKFVQVAVFHANDIPAIKMTNVIHEIALKYNEAYVLFEINYGEEVASRIYNDIEYENLLTVSVKNGTQKLLGFSGKMQYGLKTTTKTKAQMLAKLKILVESGKLEIRDYKTVNEFYTFIAKGTSYEAEADSHDDLVMSLGIFGWIVSQDQFTDLIQYDFVKEYQDSVSEEMEELLPVSMFGDSEASDMDSSWDW